MQYTITAINGGEVTVSFTDGTYAKVRIDSTATLDEIDELISRFTNAYIIDDTPNPNISVGDVRETIDWQAAEAARQSQINVGPDTFAFDWAKTGFYMEIFTAYMLANKLAAEGDSSFLDMIHARLDSLICQNSGYNLNDLKAAFNDTL